jgi:DNA-binding response OmpR family regulator
MKILVIDDDDLICCTLARILSTQGHEVATASDGRRGMAAFRRVPPDLVITDIIMPEQEGIETIRQMRRERPQTKIVAISGAAGPDGFDILAMARRLGADDVLAKPFGAAELLGSVQRLYPAGGAAAA